MRHERAYERFVSHLFDISPDETMLAFDRMLRSTIIMPSRTMTDGTEENLFELFSTVTQRSGIYTTADYAGIMAHLVRFWKIESLKPASEQARAAQEHILELPSRYAKLAERSATRRAKVKTRPVSWVLP